MAQRKGHREAVAGSARVRDSISAASREREFWTGAVVHKCEDFGEHASGLVVLRHPGLQERKVHWTIPDPVARRVRSAAVRRALEEELAPTLERLRRLARSVARVLPPGRRPRPYGRYGLPKI